MAQVLASAEVESWVDKLGEVEFRRTAAFLDALGDSDGEWFSGCRNTPDGELRWIIVDPGQEESAITFYLAADGQIVLLTRSGGSTLTPAELDRARQAMARCRSHDDDPGRA